MLVHVETEQAGEKLVNRRLAYVAVSRGRYDAQMYTNDKSQLTEELSRDISRQTAMDQAHTPKLAAKSIGPSSTLQRDAQQIVGQGFNIAR